MKELKRVMISGGGTGGHIFPALSIANEIRRRYPKCEILFVGAHGRMEADKVPAAGYEILLLPVEGFPTSKNPLKIARTLWKLMKSMRQVKKEIKRFQPQIAIGVGGYASAPTLLAAQQLGIPTLVQEQNSYAGKTNKLVGKKADAICVAYKGMEAFFPKGKRIILLGNPIRQTLTTVAPKEPKAYEYFGFDPSKQTLLIVGGSLGARSINEGVSAGLPELLARSADLQVIWQCGSSYIEAAQKILASMGDPSKQQHIFLTDFISHMEYAYSIADLVVSRAGASSISELCILGLPTLLVPSPNVTADHQTKNAMALVREGASVMIEDKEARTGLIPAALKLLDAPEQLRELKKQIKTLALPDSARLIVDEVERVVEEHNKQ